MFEDVIIKMRVPFRSRLASILLNIYGRMCENRFIKQQSLIDRSNWDVLIILDACRYDYFSQEYTKLLDGNLIEVWSPASYTVNWLKTVFPDRYNLTYVSAAPQVNSKGVPVDGYRASEHFKRIVDERDFGWDEKMGGYPLGTSTKRRWRI